MRIYRVDSRNHSTIGDTLSCRKVCKSVAKNYLFVDCNMIYYTSCMYGVLLLYIYDTFKLQLRHRNSAEFDDTACSIYTYKSN